MGSHVTPQSHVPKAGVWCPAITFFDHSTDTIDFDAQKKYYSYLSKTGLAGLVILGTNSEAFLLTREERDHGTITYTHEAISYQEISAMFEP